ncbi:MAG: efflux RND transporter permease subunit [Xanthomonadales bacterium PRO7]|nr:efflux RND transporter permease subunit [Xanthomonadales bacterium PRO7]
MTGAWLTRHQRSLLLLILILAAGGIAAAWNLPVGLFPNMDFPRVVIAIDAGDRPIERMQAEITRPLERILRSVPDVERVRSTTSRGSAEIALTFPWNANMAQALLQVQAAMNSALPSLPPGVSFSAQRRDPTVFPVLGITLTTPTRGAVGLRDFATLELAPALSAVHGVAAIEILGGRSAEFQVLLDPARLRAYGLAAADVMQALNAGNTVAAVGRIEDRYRLYLTIADSRLRDIDDIRHTVVKTVNGQPVTVGDLGSVQLGQQPQFTRVTANGGDAVLINIRQQRGANTVKLVQDVRARLAELRAQIPADIRIGTYYDQSDLIVASAASVRDAIIIGALFAALILFGFLRSTRVTLITALVLPIVIAITVLLLDVFGMSFNIMTLGGMAAAVGLIVDDAVVMIEHIMRRAGTQRAADDATVLRAAQEMLRPLTGSSLATIVVFAPLAFLGGVAGGFFKALALTMASGLVVSWALAALALPLVAARLIRVADAQRMEQADRWIAGAQRNYARRMHRALAQPRWTLPAIAACVVVVALCYWRLGTGFMPHMDEGGFVIDYVSPPGTSLTETDRLLRQVEAIIKATPEVDNYSRRTGLQLGGGLTEANEGDFFVHLKPPPRRGIEDVMSEVRAKIAAQVPGLRIETAQLMEDLIGDLVATPQPIEVKVFGQDPAVDRDTAGKVAASIAKIPGVVEVFDGVKIAGDAIEVRVDRVRAAIDGLDPDAVTRQLETELGGSLAGTIRLGEKLIGIRVWTPADLRSRIAQLGALPLRAADGHVVPLGRVADISIAQGQAEANREDQRPMVAVTARLEGRDLGSAMNDVKASVAQMKLPVGVQVEYGGLYGQQQDSFRAMALVFAGALLLIVTLLMFLYENIAVVASILIATFCSLAGVFAGLWLTNTELDLSSIMGLTMILGIVTEIAIFYFAEIDFSRALDRHALIEAGTMRMRPILMTSLIAILALSPLALGIGTGAAMQQPLAIAIVAGLIAAVPIVLILMPAVYALLARMPREASA